MGKPPTRKLINSMAQGKISNVFERLREAELVWTQEAEGPVWSVVFEGEHASLRMNDFPEEPLYTLTFRGKSIDFNDSPKGWTIP